ncbi:MAG TPA: type II toxin-antitoxin system RelE/ParE family toxin [Longimicrobiaceae bacterium]
MSRTRYRVVIQPVAKAEITEAAEWYESQQRGLGRELVREVRQAVALLKENPFMYQEVDLKMRRLLLHWFPYSVFFEVHGSDVVVHACVHQARDPAIWRQRVTR